MLLVNFLRKNKFLLGSFFLILIGIFHSISTYIYVYDGHHHGFILSNALDLIAGKEPYKEISIQYGILTTLLHSIIIKIFGNNILSINIFTVLIYYLGIIFLALTVNKYTNNFYAFLTILVVIFHHPIPWLPWSNYLAFFFLTIAIFILNNKKIKFQYIAGIFIGLTCLARENYFIFLLPVLLCMFLIPIFFKEKKESFFKRALIITTGFLSPILIFLIYLSFNKLFYYWSSYLVLPFIYAESIHDISIFGLIKNFIVFFLSSSFFKFITEPQYLLISLILIINTLFIFYELFVSRSSKQLNLIIISIICIFSSIVSINHELFRLYTSVVIGLVSLLTLVYRLGDSQIRNFSIIFLIFISIFSITFYPQGNNKAFKNLNKEDSEEVKDLPSFKFQRWEKEKILALQKINVLQKKIKENCTVEYMANFTFDAFYISISDFKNIYIVPMIRKDSFSKTTTHDHLAIHNHWVKTIYQSKSFYDIVSNEILKKNIVLLIDQNNYYIEGKKLDLKNGYNEKEIILNKKSEKPNILRFYYPKNCIS